MISRTSKAGSCLNGRAIPLVASVPVFGVLASTALLMATSASAAVYSATNYTSACTWDSTHDVSNCIQAAINAAARSGGGTVQIPSGTWHLAKPLSLTSNLVLQGVGSAELAPTAGNQSTSDLLLDGSGLKNVTVESITFDGGGQDFPNGSAVIHVGGSTGVVFNGIKVQNSRGPAMSLTGGMNNSGINNSSFVNIGNHWKTTKNTTDRVQGVIFWDASNVPQTHDEKNFATNNYFENIGLDALQFTQQDNFVASNNQFNLSGAGEWAAIAAPDYPAGIYTTQSTNVTISHNVILNAPGGGIDAPGLQGSTISNNVISGSGGAGIGLYLGVDGVTQASNLTVTQNYVTNNIQWKKAATQGGISMMGGSPNHINIFNNIVTDTQPVKTQPYGVELVDTSGIITTGSYLQINGNFMTGNIIAAMNTQQLSVYCKTQCSYGQPGVSISASQFSAGLD